MPRARSPAFTGLLILVGCSGIPQTPTPPPDANGPGRADQLATALVASATPGILDTNLPFISGEASNLFLALPRNAEVVMVPGAGIGNPVLGPGPESLVFLDRDGRINAWDRRSDRNILIEGEPGRALSGPSVSGRGDGLVFHGPEHVFLWQRVARPALGPWPVRGRTVRLTAASAWARDGGDVAEAWADADLRAILVHNEQGEVALADVRDNSGRTLRTGDLGPVRSCSTPPSGRRLLLESARGLHAYEPESRKLDALPEIDLALGGARGDARYVADGDGFLAHTRTSSGASRHVLGLWPPGRVLSARATNDLSGFR